MLTKHLNAREIIWTENETKIREKSSETMEWVNKVEISRVI